MTNVKRNLLSSTDIQELWVDRGDGTYGVVVASEMLVGDVPVDDATNQFPVIAAGRTPRVTASVAKPASATVYQNADIIANSATGSLVVPMVFDIGRSSGRLTGVRCVAEAASGALVTALLDFDLLLFRPATDLPFAAGGYPADNSPLVLTAAAMKQVVGIFSFTNGSWNTNGQATSGYQSAILSSSRPFAPFNLSDLGVTTLRGIMMARAAWNPGNVAQTFDFALDTDAD